MKREDIEKAAINNDSRLVAFRAFLKGADWRINSVWHDSNDKPDENPKNKRLIIIEHKADGNSLELSYSLIYSHTYAYYCVIRWAYVEDLIPNTED